MGASIDVPALVAQLGLESTVEIVGEVDEIGPALASSHYVVLPSIAPDSLPTILLESLRTGRPFLASDLAGPREVLGESGCGWLVEPGNVTAWTEALQAASYEAAVEAGVRARRRFEAAFTVRRFRTELAQAIGIAVPSDLFRDPESPCAPMVP